MSRPPVFVVSLVMLVACKRGVETAAPDAPAAPAGHCAVRLGPRVGPALPVPAKAVQERPPSRVVAELEAPLAAFARELEKRVGTRLAEGKGIGLGPAGSLEYTLDRGPFSLSVAGGKLLVETEVQARAEACSRGRCYASCEPRALVRAQVSLTLKQDYGFERSVVKATFTRSCKVRVLGGFLSVDVTPTIESALEPELKRAGRDIDAQLPDVRAEAERAFRELSAPQRLPLGGCISVSPIALVQGPIEDSREFLRARVALLARPELSPACDENSAVATLPPLTFDRSMPSESVATLGMVLPLASVATAFQTAPSAPARQRVARATVTAAGGALDAELALDGSVCGDLLLRAEPQFTGDGSYVTLAPAPFSSGERARVEAAGLEPKPFSTELAELVRVPVPLSPQSLAGALPLLTAALSNRSARITTDVTEVRAAGATVRGDELVAFTEARGRLRVALQP